VIELVISSRFADADCSAGDEIRTHWSSGSRTPLIKVLPRLVVEVMPPLPCRLATVGIRRDSSAPALT
jgi:hypothetical protein